MNRRWIEVLFFTFVLLMTSFSRASSGEAIRSIPVQDGGRIKPYDSFARETLELIYGKTTFKKQDESVPAYIVVLSFLLAPENWQQVPLFEITHLEVKDKLHFPQDQKYFTQEEIVKNPEIKNLLQELNDKRQSKEKLNPYFQALQRIENQLFVFRELSAGRLLKVEPTENAEGNSAKGWLSLDQLQGESQEAFIKVSRSFAEFLGAQVSGGNIYLTRANLDLAVNDFTNLVRKKHFNYSQFLSKAESEVFYNDLHPFRWAYVLYLLSAIVLLLVWIKDYSRLMKFVWLLSILGFLLHTVGFAFRVYLAERAPVTNMYETVVWMSWGAVVFSMILEKLYRFRSILFAGVLVGFISMVIADVAPAILNPAIQPLEAVLRSNYWLTIHVLTVTISYSAFALAFGLGQIGLFYFLLGENKYAEPIRKVATGIYRAMQIGVAFLTPGIILGGIWADYSWGRFWGWDPKETWALIVLLGYIIILHARLVSWIQNFGMVVSGVVTFNLVIMAWYGVNFILGAGLHSYGFGAGGVEYVAVFVTVQLLFVGYVTFLRRFQKN